MNTKPKHYLQTDPRWSKKPYRTSQEKSTIGGSGCGPTAAACIIETMTGKTFTPEDACNWSMAHGYKATGNGTYYAYFEPQFKEFGISCKMLNWTKTYGNPNRPRSPAPSGQNHPAPPPRSPRWPWWPPAWRPPPQNNRKSPAAGAFPRSA